MSILKSKTHAVGWSIEPCFIITLHIKDIEILNTIQRFFKVGAVSTTGEKFARYRVRSKEELSVIIDHFKQYPLRTSKAISFACFIEILSLMGSKQHLNVNGFLKLVSLINKLNKPLSKSVLDKLSYLGVIPNVEFETPFLDVKTKLNPS